MFLCWLLLGIYHWGWDPLWTGHMSVWLGLDGSKHNLSFALGSGTNTELLHHSAISLMSSGVMRSCCCSCSSPPLNGFSRAEATHLGAAMAYFLLVYNVNVPSKHPIPVNTLISLVTLVLFLHFSLISFLLGALKEIVYFAIIVNNSNWIIFTICIWNVHCVYIALFRVACFLHFVCALPLIFFLIASMAHFSVWNLSLCTGYRCSILLRDWLTYPISLFMPSWFWQRIAHIPKILAFIYSLKFLDICICQYMTGIQISICFWQDSSHSPSQPIILFFFFFWMHCLPKGLYTKAKGTVHICEWNGNKIL